MGLSGTTVRAIETFPLGAELVEPFGISRGAQAAVENVLVRVTLESGIRGYGEAAPLPAFNHETQAAAMRAIEQAKDIVTGSDAAHWKQTAEAIRPRMIVDGTRVLSAQCAIEMALLDALARAENKPLWRMFGEQKSQDLVTDYTITQHTGMSEADAISHAVEAAKRAVGFGVKTLKFKVGGTDVARDAKRVEAAYRVAEGLLVLLDGNAAMTADGAIELLRRIEAAGIPVTLFEQALALDDWAGMKQLRAATTVNLAADEAASSLAAAEAAIASGCFNAINIKLMKTALVESLAIIDRVKAAGLQLMIGGMVETNLAVTVSASLATGIGGFTYPDLDLPYFLRSSPFSGGAVWEKGHVLVGDAPGSGMEPLPGLTD